MNCIFLRRGYPEVETAPEILSAFADNEWTAIIYACQNNLVPSSWAVGNNKTMNIGGTNYQIDIIGKNHDTYTSGGTAPLTFQLHDCYGTKYPMTSTYGAVYYWDTSVMRNTHLPSILSKMPSEVQEAVKEVNKLTSAGNQSTTIKTTAEKLFLLSLVEATNNTLYPVSGEGTQYEYYKNGGSAIKYFSGSASIWFTRSPRRSDSTTMCGVSTSGSFANCAPSSNNGVSFAFCF